MSNKLVSRLLSFTLSATVALTSGVPALAYDGGGGEDLLEVEDEEIQLLEEEEVGSDFDAPEFEDIEVEEEASFLDLCTTDVTVTYWNDLSDSRTIRWDYETNQNSSKNLSTDCNVEHYSIEYTMDPHTGYSLTSGGGLEYNATNASNTPIAAFTVMAKATVNTYTIKFDSTSSLWIGGTKPIDQTVAFAGNIDFTTAAAKVDIPSGKILSGWTAEGTSGSPLAPLAVPADGEITDALADLAEANTEYSNTLTLTPVFAEAPTEATDLSIDLNQVDGTDPEDATVVGRVASFPFDNRGDGITLTAMDTPSIGGRTPYAAVEWSIYKHKEDYEMTGSVGSPSAADLNDDNLEAISWDDWDAYLSAHGLRATKNNSLLEIKNGRTIKAMDDIFVVKITDKGTGIGSNPISAKLLFELKIQDAALVMTSSLIESVSTRDTLVLNGGSHASPTKVTMGYTVLDADDTTNITGKPQYVKQQKVKLSGSYSTAAWANDITYEWDEGGIFTVTSDGKGVYALQDETITIAPVAGLGTGNEETETHKDTLYIKSSAWTTPYELDVEFTVTNNLDFASAIDVDGNEVTATLIDITSALSNFSVVNPSALGLYEGTTAGTAVLSSDIAVDTADTYWMKGFDLGTVKAGKSFGNIRVIAKGGNDKIIFSNINFPDDTLDGSYVPASEECTYRISGTLPASGTTVFALVAQDGATVAGSGITNYKTQPYACQITVDSADVAIKINNQPVVVGGTIADNKYEWSALKGYTKENEAKTVVVTNNSEAAITFNGALSSMTNSITGATLSGAEFTVAPASLTIASGESKEFTITPAASVSPTAISTLSGTFTVSSAGKIVATPILLTFHELGSTFDITKPATATLSQNAYIGQKYRYDFEVTKDSTVGSIEWSVSQVEVSVSDGAATPAYTWTTYTDADDIADVLEEYGFEFSPATAVLTAIPSKIPVDTTTTAKDKKLDITVKATDGTTPVYRTLQFTIANPSSDAFKFYSSDGKVLESATPVPLDFGKVAIDKFDGTSKKVTIKNNTLLDMENVTVALTSGANYDIVFDDDEVLNDAIALNGFDVIEAGDSKDITIKLVGTPGASTTPITDTITVTNELGATDTFGLTVVATDAPVINDEAVTGFTVGTPILKTGTKKYSTSYVTNPSAKFTYEITAGEVPGMELTEDGVWFGTPTKSGDYEVTVKATMKNKSEVTGTLTHTIKVAGSASVTIKTLLNGSSTATTIANNDVILLEGAIVGEEAGKIKATLNLETTLDANNVVLSIEDAEDNRDTTDTDWAADIIENPENIYKDSANYFELDKTGFKTLRAAGAENFSIVTKGSPAAGIYKVKIKITSDNSTERVIYAMMVVTDKLTITKPENVTTSVGAAYSQKLVAKGGADTQRIKWSEAGTEETVSGSAVKKYYVTKAGASGVASDVTGLTLATEASDIGAAKNAGLENTISATSMNAAGTYVVTLNAEVEAKDYNSTAGALTTGDIANRILYLSDANIKKASTKIFPAQKAEAVTYNIVSTKSNKISVDGVPTTGLGTIKGMMNGNVYATYTGFVYDEVVTYTSAGERLEISVKNDSNAKVNAKVAFGENSSFEVYGDAAKDITAGASKSFYIQPKSGLAKGTYKDTLTISGNEFDPVTFEVQFSVADPSYTITADNGKAKTDKDRVVYIEDNAKKDTEIQLDSYVAGTSPSFTSSTLNIINTGNSKLYQVSVYEVDEDGSVSTDKKLTVQTIGDEIDAFSGTTNRSISITAAKKGVGQYKAYVNVHFAETNKANAKSYDFVIPVSYTVWSSDITTLEVSPAGASNISATEGYKAEDNKISFTVTNTGTGETNTIKNLTATVTTNSSSFKVYEETTKIFKAGDSVTYTVSPVAGLSEGTYTGVVTFNGANVKSTAKQERTITFTVGASTSYEVKAVTGAGDSWDDCGDAKFATGLYNALVSSGKISGTNFVTDGTAVGGFTSATNKPVVKLDLNADGTADVAIQFTLDAAYNATSPAPSKASGYEVQQLASIGAASKAVTLTDTQIANAKKGLGDTGNDTKGHNAKYFDTITFKMYETVILGADAVNSGELTAAETGTLYAEKKTAIDNDFVKAEYAATYPVGVTGDYEGNAVGHITAYVPYGATLGSVFTSGELPIAIDQNSVLNKWRAGTKDVTKATEIIRDYDDSTSSTPRILPDMHVHEYAAASVKDERYVKWVWTKNEEGNLSAVLHLFCVDENCPDHDGSERVFEKTDATATFTYHTGTKTDATCDKAAGYTFTVDVAVAGGNTYTGEYVEEEAGEPLGHKYDLTNPAKVTWTDANKDKKITADEVKVTRTCTRDETHVTELKVVKVERDAEKSKLPTCTVAGYDVMAITYMEITENGADDKEVTVLYNDGEKFAVPATGHSEEVDVIVEDFNEENYKATVTLKCKNENCDAENHIVFGPAEVQFAEQADGTFAAEVTLIDGTKRTVTYVNHAHVWTPSWKWTAVEGDAEKKTVELTLTCNVGAKAHTKVFTDTITATKSGLKWTWAASFEADGKTYTDSTYEIRNNDGEEIAVEDISNGKGIYIVGLTEDDEFKYTGSPIKPAFSVYDAERDMTLAQGVDYTVSYSNNTKIGTAQIIVKGKGNYAEKSVAATFKIVSPIPEGETPVDLTKVKLAVSSETHTFNGEAQYPATVTVNGTVYTFDGTDYLDTENNSIPYAWAVENNINKGSGTFALVGVNNKGKDKVVKKTFKIKAAELTASNIKVFVNGEEKDATEPWAVKGAAPNVAVYFDAAGDGSFDYWMNPGQDYKLTFKNNKNVGTATVTISGKGNFAKKVDGAASFAVVPFDLETMAIPQAITAADGVKVKAVKFTLTDFDGNVIPASKYNVVVTDSEGKALDAKAKLAAGTTILVSATAKDTTNFTGATEAVEKVIGVDLSKAKIKKLDSKFGKEFTGEAIYLDDEEFNKNFTVTVKVNGTNKVLKAGEDFYISGYSNNIKKGTATAYIVGTENGEAVYSGSKKFTFKITAKKLK